MAWRAANATGNFNTAATWLESCNTPSIHASNNISITSANSFSATFTAPNTTNAVVGCWVYLVSKAAAGAPTTLTATLQEATVDTAHTATITLTNVENGSWIFFKPAASYVYTATTAGRYRWRLVCDTGTVTVAQASTANFAYMSVDNRQVVPVSGDNVFIAEANGTTAVTVTMDGTQTIGTNVTSGASRSITNALYIGTGGSLEMDTAASSTLNHRGNIFIDNYGRLGCGTSGSPLSSSYTAQIIANTNSGVINTTANATLQLHGAPKTDWKARYVSGLGTAADPMITTADIGVVGDEVYIGAASDGATNYNETEPKFIITKNSATSYVLSNTSGGVESALTYTHPNAPIANAQRNVIVKGLNTSTLTGTTLATPATTGLLDYSWVRFENISNAAFLGAVPTQSIKIAANMTVNYCVGVYGGAGLFIFDAPTAGTYTGLVTYNTATNLGLASAFANISVNGSGVNLVDSYSFASNGYGIGVSGSAHSLENCEAMACNNSGTTSAGIALTTAPRVQLANCKINANRVNGLYHAATAASSFIECTFGTDGTNGTNDIYTDTGFNTALFEDCVFGSATLIANYLNMTLGSEIRFNRYQDTDNNHRWYDTYGHGISESSVIRSPGLSVKLVPENLATGFSWSFKVPVVQNSIAGFRGYFLKNATLGTSVVTVSMYLPGNPVAGGVPDVSATLDNTTGAAFSDADEQSVNLNVEYDGDIPGAATVVVNVKSNTGGAALYADDFFNAGDRTTTYDSITGLNVWSDGKPLEVISPSVPSADDTAAAVWAALKADNNVSGSMGEQLNKTLTTGKFLGLK